MSGVLLCFAALAAIFDVRSFGAAGDGVTKNTVAIQKAIDAAHAEGGGTVVVPPGTFVSGTLYLKSSVHLKLEPGAVLKASGDLADYNQADAYPENWGCPAEYWNACHFIIGYEVSDVRIFGGGTIDGSGTPFFDDEKPLDIGKEGWREGRYTSKDRTVGRPGQLIAFIRGKDLTVSGITIRDAPSWSLYFAGSERVRVTDYTVRNDRRHDCTDGLDISCCSDVVINNLDVETGDDGIAIRADENHVGLEKPCENIRISNCRLRVQAMGIRFGVGGGDIRDVTVDNVKVETAGWAIAFQSYFSKPTNSGVDMENITVRNLTAERGCYGGYKVVSGGAKQKYGIRKIRLENCTFDVEYVRRIQDEGPFKTDIVEDSVSAPGGAQARSIEPLLGHRLDSAFDHWRVPEGAAYGYTNGTLYVSGGRKLRLDYDSYPKAKPIPGPDAVVVRLVGAFEGQTRLHLRHQLTGKSQRFEAVRVPGGIRFDTKLPSVELWQFEALDFELPKGNSEGVRLAIAALEVETLSSRAEALRFDIDTGDPIRVVRAGTPRATFVFTNFSNADITWKGKCRLSDYFGNVRTLPVEAFVRSGGSLRVPFDLPAGKGIWYATLEVAAEDGSSCRRTVNFAVLDENKVQSAFPDGQLFRMGANYHMTRVYKTPGILTNTLHALDLCGARIVRVEFGKFSSVMRGGPDTYNWDSSDKMLALLEEHGLGVDTIIFSAPKWARDTEGKDLAAIGKRIDNLPARRGLFRDYCEKLAARYGTRISYYELGNEPDLRRQEVYSPDEYVERIYNEGYEGLKKGCPEAGVIPGGFAFASSEHELVKQKGFQERFLEMVGSRMFAHPVHVHSSFKRYREDIGVRCFANRAKYGITAPWYSNESALSSFQGMEATAAQAVWKKILWAWGNGSRDYIWYNLRATGWNPKDPEQGYGIITADFQPRATFAAFAELSNLVSGLATNCPLVQTDVRFVYRLTGVKDGKTRSVLAGWDEVATKGEPIVVKTDAKRVWAVDMMGNRTPLEVQNGSVTWMLGKLPGALLAEAVTFLEPSADDLARAIVPEDMILVSSADDWVPEAFRLDKPEKVYDNYAANPETVKRAWSGKDDLSARVWMHPWTGGIRMVVTVTDDIHCQPRSDNKIFQGDSIQFAVAIPGVVGDWEVGLARLEDGKPYVHVWRVPVGVDPVDSATKIPLKVSRDGNVTKYETLLSYDLFRLNTSIIRDSGFRFNLLVNDNDGYGGVDCWTEIKPGIANGKNVFDYPMIRFGE